MQLIKIILEEEVARVVLSEHYGSFTYNIVAIVHVKHNFSIIDRNLEHCFKHNR